MRVTLLGRPYEKIRKRRCQYSWQFKKNASQRGLLSHRPHCTRAGLKTRISSSSSVHMVSNMPTSWQRSFPIPNRTCGNLYIYIMWVIIRPLSCRVRGFSSDLSTERKGAETSQAEKRSFWPAVVYTQFQALKVFAVQFLYSLGFKFLISPAVKIINYMCIKRT
jgi:hypothetical protein